MRSSFITLIINNLKKEKVGDFKIIYANKVLKNTKNVLFHSLCFKQHTTPKCTTTKKTFQSPSQRKWKAPPKSYSHSQTVEKGGRNMRWLRGRCRQKDDFFRSILQIVVCLRQTVARGFKNQYDTCLIFLWNMLEETIRVSSPAFTPIGPKGKCHGFHFVKLVKTQWTP